MKLSDIQEKMQNYTPSLLKKPREAAVLCLIREQNGETEVLFEVRSSRLSHQPNEICFPGGGIEEGESPLSCALRETEEELGLSREDIHIICSLDPIVHANSQRVYPFLGYVTGEKAVVYRTEEVAEVFSVPLHWFKEHPPKRATYAMTYDEENCPPELMQFLTHYRRERPTVIWTWENKVIWGLTAKILLKLVETLYY